MSNTKEGGRKAAMTNRRRYGTDFYQRIGRLGGSKGHGGGFAAHRELAVYWGRINGKKRGKHEVQG